MDTNDLPELVQERLDDIAQALGDLATGGGTDPIRALQEAVSEAFEAARGELFRKERGERPPGQPIALADVAKRHAAALRKEAGWKQDELAEAMNRLGFDWKRLTVSEIESGARKVSPEEMLGLAILFDEPAIWFLSPPVGTWVEVGKHKLDSWIVRELWWGAVEDAGPEPGPVPGWEVTTVITKSTRGVPDWRPVWDRGRFLRSRELRGQDGEH